MQHAILNIKKGAKQYDGQFPFCRYLLSKQINVSLFMYISYVSGACDGTVKSRPASERRTLYTMFDSTKESTKST